MIVPVRDQLERDRQTIAIANVVFVFAAVVAAGAGVVWLGQLTFGEATGATFYLVVVAAVVASVAYAERSQRLVGAPATGTRLRDEWSRAARITAWALLLSWVAVAATMLFVGEARSTYQQLEQDVRSGDVTAVRVTEGLEPGAIGYALVEVHWRKGPFAYVTDVVEANPRSRGSAQPQDTDVTARFLPSTADRLHEIEPALQVTRTDDRVGGEVFGRAVPSWIVLPTLVLMLITVTYLVAAPPTWRATKWAWFWLLGIVPPLGIVLFLVLGGPTRVVPAPRAGSRQLTGGWAFLVSSVCGSVFLHSNR